VKKVYFSERRRIIIANYYRKGWTGQGRANLQERNDPRGIQEEAVDHQRGGEGGARNYSDA
jgi:hypothetical protein